MFQNLVGQKNEKTRRNSLDRLQVNGTFYRSRYTNNDRRNVYFKRIFGCRSKQIFFKQNKVFADSVYVQFSISAMAKEYTLTLEKAIELGLQNHQQLKIADAKTDVSEHQLKAAKNQLLPSVEFSANAFYLGDVSILNSDWSKVQTVEMPHFGNTFGLQASPQMDVILPSVAPIMVFRSFIMLGLFTTLFGWLQYIFQIQSVGDLAVYFDAMLMSHNPGAGGLRDVQLSTILVANKKLLGYIIIAGLGILTFTLLHSFGIEERSVYAKELIFKTIPASIKESIETVKRQNRELREIRRSKNKNTKYFFLKMIIILQKLKFSKKFLYFCTKI